MKIITDPTAVVILDRFSVEAVTPVDKRKERSSGRRKNRDRRKGQDSPVDTVTLSGTGPAREEEDRGP